MFEILSSLYIKSLNSFRNITKHFVSNCAKLLCHIICISGEWQMLISEGTIPDTPPLEVAESTCIVKVDKPVREYYKTVIKSGFAHHAIACPAAIGKEMRLFAEQIGVKVIEP